MSSRRQPGWVYVAENIDTRPKRIKIGWTRQGAEGRRKAIGNAGGCRVRLLGFFWGTPEDRNTEWHLHRRFARWSVQDRNKPLGEWFSYEIKAEVMKIVCLYRNRSRPKGANA